VHEREPSDRACTEPRPYFGSVAGLGEDRPGVARVDLHRRRRTRRGAFPKVTINSGLAVSSSRDSRSRCPSLASRTMLFSPVGVGSMFGVGARGGR
jgi:hypothetical protein